jgi:hypothetical protein
MCSLRFLPWDEGYRFNKKDRKKAEKSKSKDSPKLEG